MTFAYRPIYWSFQGTIEQLLASYFQLRTSFCQDGLTYADLFDGILIASFSDLQGRRRRVQFSTGDELLLPEPGVTLVIPLCLIEHGARLSYHWRALGINSIIRAIQGETKTRPCLLQRCLRLPQVQARIGRIELGDHLAL